ncbi:MAG: DnaT-like ssDNA-binding domain-containing protein [Endozoicomonadaceae bacterium]|nr:DnaT-like ssDNA-binding domain-containing protein [Endozoicomonadaceae bacterium]MCY4330589.1 DnaT-like ssDNA-binding domain-containing protein [Endozoicomonadaceae bacterium]
MRRNGQYYLGPFDAYYSESQSKKNTSEDIQWFNRKTDQKSSRTAIPERRSISFSNSELMLEAHQYEKELETISRKVASQELRVSKQKQTLEDEECTLHKLNQYREVLSEKLSQMRQQMDNKSNNQIFCSTEDDPRKSLLSDNYQPPDRVIEVLVEFHQIPPEFIKKQLIEFKIYYAEIQEKRTGWDQLFYKWVIRGWKRDKHKKTIDKHFCPDQTSVEELTAEAIDEKFCQQEIEKFILYWQEQKAAFTPILWQERFKQWVRRAWKRNKANEKESRPSYPTTEEFADTEKADKYQFSFE